MFPVDHNRPLVMGILNITPDSFSDGGVLYRGGSPDLDKISGLAETLINQGADLLDIGGESTRPGAELISESEEIDRVIPVVEALTTRFDIPLSIDTSTPEVISLAAAEGAAMINDVRALGRPGAIEAAAVSRLPVTLMHMQGEPQTMQQSPVYSDVVSEVATFLTNRVLACEQAGIDQSKLVLDPGFGFGKTLQHNLCLFQALPNLVALGMPIMVGLSRKRMIGEVLNKPVEERGHGSIAMAMLAAQKGVRMIRVHDVGGTVDALKMLTATET
jgi:dihydropteroate synthase